MHTSSIQILDITGSGTQNQKCALCRCCRTCASKLAKEIKHIYNLTVFLQMFLMKRWEEICGWSFRTPFFWFDHVFLGKNQILKCNIIRDLTINGVIYGNFWHGY